MNKQQLVDEVISSFALPVSIFFVQAVLNPNYMQNPPKLVENPALGGQVGTT